MGNLKPIGLQFAFDMYCHCETDSKVRIDLNLSTPITSSKNKPMLTEQVYNAVRRLLSIVRPLLEQLIGRKPMIALQAEIDTQLEFRRTLNWFQLLAIGVGAMIGTGIFVLSGTAASSNAGPSVIISFVLTGVIA
ncbi:unnamed protein product, partial [Rotaria magnacalcarata]